MIYLLIFSKDMPSIFRQEGAKSMISLFLLSRMWHTFLLMPVFSTLKVATYCLPESNDGRFLI